MLNSKFKWVMKLVLLALPLLYPFNLVSRFLTKYLINKLLARLSGYNIILRDIKIRFAGIYIDDIHFSIPEGTSDVPLELDIKSVEVGFNRAAIWSGVAACQVFIDTPVASFLIPKSVETKQEKEDSAKKQNSITAVPFVIETFEINNGSAGFKDGKAGVSVWITAINFSGQNITNMVGDSDLPSVVELTGWVCGGSIHTNAKIAIKETPAFDLNTEVKNVQLINLNDAFLNYGKFSVKDGVLDVFIEAAAADGKFKGYVKPLIQHLELDKEAQQPDGFLTWVKKTGIEAFNAVFENPGAEQLGTKIPFGGSFHKPRVNVFWAIIETLYNGFISALKPSIDHEIGIGSVKNNGSI